MRHYTQLTEHVRYQIYALMKAQHTQDEIAENLGRNKGTISRELRRNRGLRGYRPKQTQRFAAHRQGKAAQRIDAACWADVDEQLRPVAVHPNGFQERGCRLRGRHCAAHAAERLRPYGPADNGKMMAVAAIDRLIHHAHVFELSGESSRKRAYNQQHKKVSSDN